MRARRLRHFRRVRGMEHGWDERLSGDTRNDRFGVGGFRDLHSFAKVEVARPQGGRAGGDDAGADFPAGGDQSPWEE